MNSVFKKWLNIQVNHSYFGDRGFSGFDIRPLESSSLKMKNYGLLIRKEGSTISIYYDTNSGDSRGAEQPLRGLDTLAFELVLQDDLFYQYSDLPFPEDGEMLCFYNSSPSSESDNDLISLSSISVRVFPENGTVINQLSVAAEATSVKVTDDSSNGPGLTDPSVVFFNKDNQPEHMNGDFLFGTGFLLVLDAKKISSSERLFAIHIDAKKTFYEYKIIVKNDGRMNIGSIEITGAADELFDYKGEEQMMDGVMAKIFHSPGPQPLQHQADQLNTLKLTYTSDFSSGPKKLELVLPMPAADSVRKYDQASNDKWLASTIVYV